MRDGDAHETHGAGKGCHTGAQDAGQQNHCRTEAAEVDAHVLGVGFAELVGAEGLCQKGCQEHGRDDDDGHDVDVLPVGAGEAAL